MRIYFSIIMLFVLFSPSVISAEPIQLERTEYIHFNTPIIDTHVDTMMEVIDESTWLPQTDIGTETNFHFDLEKAKLGGVNVPFLAAYTSGFYENTPRSISRTLAMLNGVHWTLEQNTSEMEIATSLNSLKEITRNDKVAAFSSIEGAYALNEENAVELTEQFYDIGVRMIGFTWNYSNTLGEGANRVYGNTEQTPSEGGLTELGENVVRKMNELGMIVDVSHMARETFWDVLEISEAPIIASHSGVNALKEHQRNLTDEQLLALKENRGVISIVFYPAFLTDHSTGYVSDIVDHIDYVVDLIGIDYVGIGSDYDGASMPEDLQNVSDFPKIIEELAFRGYTKQEIEQILGGNVLRLLEEVEAAGVKPDSSTTSIYPAIEMGEAISDRNPLLAAEVKGKNIDNSAFNIIVDGIRYEADYEEESAVFSLAVPESLEEKFHIVTFEVASEDGAVNRETRIFYISE
ncbi:dipeptidase [Oceanobacillus sp. CAU 1775]